MFTRTLVARSCFIRPLSAFRSIRSESVKKIFEPELEKPSTSERKNLVISRIAERVSDQRNRLFAIIYINRRQFKVSQDDIIHIHHNVPLDIGDKIKLEKVLMVGGKDFSIFGRPLLNPEHVTVHATVIEKTVSSPEVDYTHISGKQIQKLDWLSHELTVLRINEILVDKAVLGKNNS